MRVTWLLLLNFIMLQWFGVRMIRTRALNDDGVRVGTIGFTLAFGFVPLTGWWSPFRGRAAHGPSVVLWTSSGLKRWRAR